MPAFIESLENRRLLAGHGPVAAGLLAKAEGVDDPAVQADVVAIKADQAAIDAAQQQLRSDTSDTRAALKTVLENGATLLAADRQAVRDAKDDPTAFDAAKAKLKADRAALRQDVADARQAVRDDATDARADLKTALSSLVDHLKQLKTDLQAAGAIPTRPKPDANGNIAVTPDQAQEAVGKINEVAAGVNGIDQNAVNALTGDLTDAASDSSVTPEERQKLSEDLRAVLSTVKLRDLREVVSALKDLARITKSAPFRG
jgi:hypothetical protein